MNDFLEETLLRAKSVRPQEGFSNREVHRWLEQCWWRSLESVNVSEIELLADGVRSAFQTLLMPNDREKEALEKGLFLLQRQGRLLKETSPSDL